MEALERWQPPADWLRITAVDAHTEGEPLRVIVSGFPAPEGRTILERRRYLRERWDHLRTALMWEPRGHADMYGCVVTPPVSPEADVGILFLHNEGYSTMCGHGVIGVVKVLLETGVLPVHAPETTVRLDTPAGLVTARARIRDGRVASVRFENVPSFVLALDQRVQVPDFGTVRYDVAFGGAFYAFVRVDDLGLRGTATEVQDLIACGRAIKRAIAASCPIDHPFEPDLGFLYGTIFVAPAQGEGVHSRHICIFAEGEVDRSPTGTGVSARLAILHARGEVAVGETLTIESIIGSRFQGRILHTIPYGPYEAVVPEIEGTAFLTGRHEFWIDPADPLRWGFILR